MRAPRLVVAGSLMVAAVVAPSFASAGTTAPLSSIAALPGPVALKTPELPQAVPGVVVKSKDGHASTRWHDVNAATSRGYCLTSTQSGFRWISSWGTSDRGTAEDLDLVRLQEKDGKATLERTRVHFDPPSATLTAMGRSQVELKEIARTPAGVVVWAYRDGRDVVVLTRHVDRGVESRRASDPDDAVFPFVSGEGCPFAGARIDGRKPEAGAFVQLNGSLPAKGTGKDKVVPTFIVDASLSRVARDPEPRLAVRVRVRD